MEEGLKRRLLGAGVLVSLAVIFVPVIVDTEQMASREISGSNIPERPADAGESRVRPLGGPSRPRTDAPLGAESEIKALPSGVYEPPTEAYTLLDIPPDAAPAPPSSTPAARTPAPPPMDEGLPPPQGWVLQVGSFSNAGNAERLVTELRGRGFAGFMEEVDVRGKVLYRVLVGPEARREGADQLVTRLEDWMRDRKLAGRVKAYP